MRSSFTGRKRPPPRPPVVVCTRLLSRCRLSRLAPRAPPRRRPRPSSARRTPHLHPHSRWPAECRSLSRSLTSRRRSGPRTLPSRTSPWILPIKSPPPLFGTPRDQSGCCCHPLPPSSGLGPRKRSRARVSGPRGLSSSPSSSSSSYQPIRRPRTGRHQRAQAIRRRAQS